MKGQREEAADGKYKERKGEQKKAIRFKRKNETKDISPHKVYDTRKNKKTGTKHRRKGKEKVDSKNGWKIVK